MSDEVIDSDKHKHSSLPMTGVATGGLMQMKLEREAQVYVTGAGIPPVTVGVAIVKY
jgi:hypothetical protein